MFYIERNENTALMLATNNGRENIEMVELLLKETIEIDAVNK